MKTNPPYLHLFILILLLSGVCYLSVVTAKKQSELNKVSDEISNLSANIEKLEQLGGIFPRLTDEIRLYKKTLPQTEAEVAVFASTIERIAKESAASVSLHIDDFTKQVDVSTQRMNGLGIQIDLTGSFRSVVDFQTRLSEIPFFYKIDKMLITKNENADGVKMVLNGFLMMDTKKDKK